MNSEKMKETAPRNYHPFAFILLLIFLLSIAGTFLTPSLLKEHSIAASGAKLSTGLLKEKKNSIDVLVIGDSESYTSISPMELWNSYKITSYAAGKPGAKIAETVDTLKESMRSQSPRVVLLETNNLFRYKTGGGGISSEFADWIYDFFPALRYHNIWKDLLPLPQKKTFKGFRLSSEVRPFTGKSVGKAVTGNKITPQTLKYLDEIEALCQKKGATLVLYSAPSPKCYNSRKTGLLAQLAKKRGLRYLNLNARQKELGIDWSSDTRDHGDHLNTAGALKTTDYIGRFLKENYTFPDRSGSTVARSWNRMYPVYASAVNRTMERILIKRGLF